MDWPFKNYHDILDGINRFDDTTYASTRNYLNGNVSKFSPYLSRGIISTKFVFDVVTRNNPKAVNGKFVQELLWRDYFQRLLQSRPDLYRVSLRQDLSENTHKGIPIAVLNAATGIDAIDKAINELYETGYMHNHFRMYVAALCCNIAKSNFTYPAKWMYYHLLDADIGSNYASWQWISGNLTGKQYLANQENINRYSESEQSGTFLDKTYEALSAIPQPESLKEFSNPVFETLIPDAVIPNLQYESTLLYTIYNLDPNWEIHKKVNRVLILEPSHFDKFPISEKVLRFILEASKNIKDLQIFCGEFDTLSSRFPFQNFTAKEHPILKFEGVQITQRDWIVPEVEGFFQSFSKYYSQCQKYLNNEKK